MQSGLLYREDMFRDYDHAAKRAQGYGFTIDYNGLWYHHDGDHPGPIRRQALAALFGGAGQGFMAGKGLKRDESGRYWLASPEGRYEVAVEDVPFVITRFEDDNGLVLITNFDEAVRVGAEHPLFLRAEPLRGEAVLYVEVRDGLLARCAQGVHFALVQEYGREDAQGYFIETGGMRFALKI